ncbi:MAG: alpha/beta hydrolase [Rhodospirillaceae bacterium]|nr:alpha/beta hydrolase [Rhodospirillaceae bacterium]
MKRFAKVLMLGALGCGVAAAADKKADEVPRYSDSKVTWDADGTLHVPAFSYPLSEFMSPELKKAYARQVADLPTWPGPPAMDAPMDVWKTYWKQYDEIIMAPSLKRWREIYPVTIEPKVYGGVRTEIIVPKGGVAPENKNRVLINLHGGGFYTGAGAGGQQESIPVAGRMKIKVVTVDYRMAPQHKFPAASEDVATVYRELLKDYKPGNIGIYGCSAGGSLTSQAAAWFQTHNLPNPGGIGVFCAGGGGGPGDMSPWGAGGVFTPPKPRTGAVTPGYMASADKNDPMAAPVKSDAVMAKFPPTLLVSGTRAGDLSPAAYMHTRLLKNGVDAELYVIEGGWHGVFNQQPDTPESRDTYDYIAKWFDSHLGK